MTDKQQQLAEALADQDRRPVPEAAKRLAIAAALEAFDQQQKNAEVRQGFFARWRQKGKSTTDRVSPMTNLTQIIQNKWLYTGVATASVAVLAVLISQPPLSPALLPDFKAPMPMSEAESVPAGTAESKTEEVVVTAARRQAAEREAVADAADSQRQAGQRSVAKALAPATPAPMAALMMQESVAAPEPLPQAGYQDLGRDQFQAIEDNPVQRATEAPVSTFSVDVDTASYSFVRRQLNQGVLPQKDAVRVEEMVNYFDYAYPLPTDKKTPFTTNVLVTDSPWRAGNKLMHIGIKGYELAGQKPRSNLVFLLDVSGSMDAPDKLPLVKQSMELLLSQLNPDDTVAIAVYAGAAGTVLAPTPAREKQKILQAMHQLQAGGSTAGAQGIQLAYQLAAQHFDPQAVNRVILATDGDFNVGITSRDELKGFVERERDKGIYLSVLGFGQGNYQDHLMQELAQNGNGVAAYIDTLSEAQKVLVTEATRALFPIAQDVKIQVEFNPATVAEYRLIGYETRALQREDFNNDKVDAGDIGAGHTVTAIYELTPVGGDTLIDASRYGQPAATEANTGEYAFVKLRYKLPGQTVSELLEQPVAAGNTANETSRVDGRLLREVEFATAVAGFGQLLRGGQYTGNWTYDDALALAQANKGDDPYGYRTELVQLIRKAKLAKSL